MLTTNTDACALPAGRAPVLGEADENRLALLAKLTEYGVPPGPGDRTALAALSALDSGTVSTVVQWLAHAAATAAPSLAAPAPLPADPGGSDTRPAPRRRPVISGAPLPPPSPAALVDPRLLSW